MNTGLNPFSSMNVAASAARSQSNSTQKKVTSFNEWPVFEQFATDATLKKEEDDFINYVFTSLETAIGLDDPIDTILIDTPARFGHAVRDLYQSIHPLPFNPPKPLDPLYDISITDALDNFAKSASNGDTSLLENIEALRGEDRSEVLRIASRVLSPKAYAMLLEKLVG